MDGETIGDIESGKVGRSEAGVLGYCLTKRFRGKGIMTEALGEVVRFVFFPRASGRISRCAVS